MKKLHKCPNCGGNLEKKIISHTLTRGQKVFDFEDVPVRVCAQCGGGLVRGRGFVVDQRKGAESR